MASKKAYEKALRAAKSVVAGRKQGAGAALAGLALIAYLPGCTQSNPDPVPVDTGSDVTTLLDTSKGDVQQVLSDIHDMLSTDAPMVEDEGSPLPDLASADEGPVPTDEGPAPTDEATAPTDEGSSEDAVAQGWINTFPETCLQPTGNSCTTSTDCEVTSATCTEGACMASSSSYTGTGASCAGPDECNDEQLCMSNQCHDLSAEALLASECCENAFDPVVGCLQATDTPCTDEADCTESNGMQCVNDLCHASQLSNHPMSAHADECCNVAYGITGCNFTIPMGCYPWGPPAPPAYNGVRLKDLLQAEVA
jgi:hypothetical protein